MGPNCVVREDLDDRSVDLLTVKMMQPNLLFYIATLLRRCDIKRFKAPAF